MTRKPPTKPRSPSFSTHVPQVEKLAKPVESGDLKGDEFRCFRDEDVAGFGGATRKAGGRFSEVESSWKLWQDAVNPAMDGRVACSFQSAIGLLSFVEALRC